MSFWYRLLHRLFGFLVRLLTHLDLSGTEHIPRAGPLIVSPNHLHVLDSAIVFAVIPRRLTAFAADKWQRTVGGWLMRVVANAIFVARGEADRDALGRALRILKEGGALAVAPEGTRSRTGGLLPGKNGTVYLASRSGAAILPIAMWGQERAMETWARLRRPKVTIRILPPIILPESAARARTAELQTYTEELMLTVARALPPQYCGVYAERAQKAGDGDR